MKINCASSKPIKINDKKLEGISSFVYLGSTVSVNGGTEEDIKVRINKAQVAFNLLKKIWNSQMEMDWSHFKETSRPYYKTSSEMESPR